MCHLAVEEYPSTRYYINNFPLKLSLSCLHSTNFITREGETLFLLEKVLPAVSLWMKKKEAGDIYANSWTKQNFHLSDLSKADTHHAWVTTQHLVYQRHTVWWSTYISVGNFCEVLWLCVGKTITHEKLQEKRTFFHSFPPPTFFFFLLLLFLFFQFKTRIGYDHNYEQG